MGSLNPDAESKQELDDSGYVQDETGAKQAADAYKGTAQLLDLSDDVLLYILRNCTPQELKAIGFTCPRLGALVLDRTLWVDVDAHSTPHGRRRVRWLLAHALGAHTRRLRLVGYARQAEGCLGFVNRLDMAESNAEGGASGPAPSGSAPLGEDGILCSGSCVYKVAQALPRYGGGFPYWPYPAPLSAPATLSAPAPLAPAPPAGCPGPQLSLTHTGLRELTALCCGLRTLELEDCVIDCKTTHIGMFPKTLTRLSLRGTKCFNLESKSFLFKIQDHLTHLEELDVSYCSWIEPACMLPLSKMPCLRTLAMRECHKLAEFVAYASLATRYGFKKLKVLDLRGSPVGDSEVSALGWLPALEELYLSPSPAQPHLMEHAHYSQELLPTHSELEEWEETDPEYFKAPSIPDDEWTRDENQTCYKSSSGAESPACVVMERIMAEPFAPHEYSQAYHILDGHHDIPLVNLDDYREVYQQYMARPDHGPPPMHAGYSLLVRGAGRGGPGPPDAKPGTSAEDEAKPSSSADCESGEQQTDDALQGASEPPGASDADGEGPNRRPPHKRSANVEPATSIPPIPAKSTRSLETSRPPGPPDGDGQRPNRPPKKRSSEDSSDEDCPPQKRLPNVESVTSIPPIPAKSKSEASRPPGPSDGDGEGPNCPPTKHSSEDSSDEDFPPQKRAANAEPGASIPPLPPKSSRPPGPSDKPPGDSSDEDRPRKRACPNEPTAAETSSRDDSNWQRRRFYEIMIHQVIPRRRQRERDEANNDGANDGANGGANDGANGGANDGANDGRRHRLLPGRFRPIVDEYIDLSAVPPLGLLAPRGMLLARGPVALLGPARLDHTSLVTDSSIRRFGRAVGENINYIHIGGGDGRDANARPDRSVLRVLSVAGFRRVTDASLQHLATAAPRLRRLDVSDTAVTARAVRRFQAMRPDVDVTASDGAASPPL